MKYVTAAVALAVLLCAAAVVKVAVARTEKAPPAPAWVAPSVTAAVTGAPESTPDTVPPTHLTAGASTPVMLLDPKAAAKAAKEKAKLRGKNGVDRAASTTR